MSKHPKAPPSSTFSFTAPFPTSSTAASATAAAPHKQRRVSLALPSSTRQVPAWTFRDDTGLDPRAPHEPRGKMRKLASGESSRAAALSPSPPPPPPEKKARKKWTMEETHMLVEGCNRVSPPLLSSRSPLSLFFLPRAPCHTPGEWCCSLSAFVLSMASATGRRSCTTPLSTLITARPSISKTGASYTSNSIAGNTGSRVHTGSAPTSPTHTNSTTPTPKHTSPPRSAPPSPTAPPSSKKRAPRSAARSPRRRTARSRPATTSTAPSGPPSSRTPSSRSRTAARPTSATASATRSPRSTRPRDTSPATPPRKRTRAPRRLRAPRPTSSSPPRARRARRAASGATRPRGF